jgi:hypothetical protein
LNNVFTLYGILIWLTPLSPQHFKDAIPVCFSFLVSSEVSKHFHFCFHLYIVTFFHQILSRDFSFSLAFSSSSSLTLKITS